MAKPVARGEPLRGCLWDAGALRRFGRVVAAAVNWGLVVCWIPAFAGMTDEDAGMTVGKRE